MPSLLVAMCFKDAASVKLEITIYSLIFKISNFLNKFFNQFYSATIFQTDLK